MSIDLTSENNPNTVRKSGWLELVLKEDWLAVWVGLFLVLAGILFWTAGSSIKVLTAQITKWTDFPTLGSYPFCPSQLHNSAFPDLSYLVLHHRVLSSY
ncbi:MAG: Inner rane protein [Sporolactobacillus laevolacticus]|nr:Inner rane protein [Sporolactobacillus laevolacticus]